MSHRFESPPESPRGIRERQEWADRQRAEEKAKNEQFQPEAEARRWERWKAKVKREEEQRAEERRVDAETIAAMSPEALHRYYSRHPPDVAERAPSLPPRYVMAMEDNRRDEAMAANREREQAERDAGLPAKQAAWQQRVQAIEKARADAIREAEAAKAAARETAREALEELGPCPTLESLEAMPV